MGDAEDRPCAADEGLLATWRWSRSAREQVQLKQKIRDLPALLKHGLHLRKKSAEAQSAPDTIPGQSTEISKQKVCAESFPCAGRALRNAFLSHSLYPARDRIHLARIIRRSYVGLELVQWLLEQCLFVQCRAVAARVWQVLLELGILLSVDQHVVFEDSNVFYQFSYDECELQHCEFKSEKDWQDSVRLLLQLVPYVQFRVGVSSPPDREAEQKKELCNEILQMKALERLTSTVQNELAAALARKARRSVAVADEEEQAGAEEAGPEQERSGEKPPSEETSRVCLKERGQDVLVLQRASSERPAPLASAGGGREEEKDRRYVVVSGTPEKILEHLLSDLRLDEGQGTQGKETETLLDDFLLTYLVFMSTSDLCQALLGHYCSKRYRSKEESQEALFRKRKVLHLVSQWTALYRDVLREEEHVKLFMKTLYRYVLDDLYEYPTLEKDLKEFQKLLRMHRRHTVDEYSPHRKNKALFHQFSLKENWLQPRGPHSEAKEVFCRVYVTTDSYVSVKAKAPVSAQELLRAVAEKMEQTEEDMVLMVVTFTGEKNILQLHDSVYSESLPESGRLVVCRKDLSDIMNPFSDNAEVQHRAVRMLGMNTWDVAVALTNFDWSLFNSVHEQELIHYTFGQQGGSRAAVGLELLLQRCDEVQMWVMTEILLCTQLCKRVQLVKKFVKIAAHCRAQRNLNSFFAIIMGLNTAAVSRLSHTWEKVPGKFRKLFSELELLTDPSLNHKAYRDAFKKMKPPKIPFMPLLLKDITFIHEGNKTFLDNLVNFEKLHMIADTVRLVRHCQTDQLGSEGGQKDSQEVRSYVHHLHIIDNQQALFELSHRLEPRA
ncbi:rap guanine nucleotide exchange factor 5 isoform X2 [Lepisosteus oculatus]|uniref:rap guanine nucleotide exchange factor 5 isoform X2 n=1 Tax=Lepisosteus oculatus TaxID=7918 RepID=UPI0035F50A65